MEIKLDIDAETILVEILTAEKECILQGLQHSHMQKDIEMYAKVLAGIDILLDFYGLPQ